MGYPSFNMPANCILIVDGDKSRREELTQTLVRLHFSCWQAENGEDALTQIESHEPDIVLCHQAISVHSPKELAEYVHDFGSGHTAFILLVAQEESDPNRCCQEIGADFVLSWPLADCTLSCICRLLLDNTMLRSRLGHLQEENLKLRQQSTNFQILDPATGFYHFKVFKHVILMEVKKAQRYNYSLSILLLTFDHFQEMAGWLSVEKRNVLFAALHREISQCIRDIDIPLLFGEGKVLVVLPHTDIDGAAKVADRTRERVARLPPPESMKQLRITVSLAVASTKGGEQVSFSKLIQEAMRGLKEAQLKGGDLVVVLRSEEAKAEGEESPFGGKLGPRTFF
jgi:two-component system, cell cycle response regulator